MNKKNRLSFRQIADALRNKRTLLVESERERKDALLAASAIGIEITTRERAKDSFQIIYLNGGSK